MDRPTRVSLRTIRRVDWTILGLVGALLIVSFLPWWHGFVEYFLTPNPSREPWWRATLPPGNGWSGALASTAMTMAIGAGVLTLIGSMWRVGPLARGFAAVLASAAAVLLALRFAVAPPPKLTADLWVRGVSRGLAMWLAVATGVALATFSILAARRDRSHS